MKTFWYRLTQVLYGIVEFNVPFDTAIIGHFGVGDNPGPPGEMAVKTESEIIRVCLLQNVNAGG